MLHRFTEKIIGIGSKQMRYLMVLICVSLIFLLMLVLDEEQSILQTIVGATADGATPNTLRQVDEFVAMRGEEDLVVAYSDARRKVL